MFVHYEESKSLAWDILGYFRPETIINQVPLPNYDEDYSYDAEDDE